MEFLKDYLKNGLTLNSQIDKFYETKNMKSFVDLVDKLSELKNKCSIAVVIIKF